MERNYDSNPPQISRSLRESSTIQTLLLMQNSLGFCDMRYDSTASRVLHRQYGYPMMR